jgi:hypothetical protein
MRVNPPHPKLYAQVALCAVLALCAHAASIDRNNARATPARPTQVKPELNLSKYQTEAGMIVTFAGGEVADPYFGLYSLNLAELGGLDVTKVRTAFIKWGLAEQKADGTFDRYCKKSSVWVRCGKADSDDANLVRWTHLLYASAPKGQPLPAAWQKSAVNAEKVLMSMRMQNGIFSVFRPGTPGYDGYALFKDNVEVMSMFRQTAEVLTARGDSARAAEYVRRADDLHRAMKSEFGNDPFKMKRLALGATYEKATFYPHAVATPFAWMSGYYAPPSQGEWAKWLSLHTDDWLSNAKKDFPWGLMAVSALQTGSPAVAACWAQRHGAQSKTGAHWNVLEEVSLQIINHAKPTASNCPAYQN